MLIISPDILKQSNLNLQHQAALLKDLNHFFQDMVSLRPSLAIMGQSTPPMSWLTLHHHTTSSTLQAAHYFRRAMDKQNVPFKQPRNCLRMLKIPTWLS